MEEGFYHENPSIAASKSFPLNQYYKPWNLAKPQSYYATILEITNFVKFKHFKLHSDHTELTYSTCIIHKVIHSKDWRLTSTSPIPYTLSYKPQDFNTFYTYWDYQQAWFNAFLLQNQNHSHSWLFYFYSVMNTTNLPLQFLQWWDYYDCHVDYLKEHPLVENGYLHFKNNFQLTPSERKFPSLLIFYTKFFVSWVCSWFYDYNIQNGHPVLIRKFKIKWWDSFAAESKSSKLAVTEWLQKQLPSLIIILNQNFQPRRLKCQLFLPLLELRKNTYKQYKTLYKAKTRKQSCPNSAHLTRHLLPFLLETIMNMTALAFCHLSRDIKKKVFQAFKAHLFRAHIF